MVLATYAGGQVHNPGGKHRDRKRGGLALQVGGWAMD